MSRWRIENDDGWFIVYKDGVEVASSENGDCMADVLNDAFHDANARIAELEAERRWIPVSERLPEKGNLVIGITDYCGYVFFEIVDDDGQGIVLHPYRRCQGKVTHWMPLPEPPEVKE